MKRIFYLLPFALLALCTACTQDDDNAYDNVVSASYWMTQSEGSIAGGSYTFDFGMITWTFNAEDQTVLIQNNNEDPNAYDGPDSGIYPYTIEDSEVPDLCAKVIVIDGVDYGCFYITEGGLTLTNTYSDGYTYTFTNVLQD